MEKLKSNWDSQLCQTAWSSDKITADWIQSASWIHNRADFHPLYWDKLTDPHHGQMIWNPVIVFSRVLQSYILCNDFLETQLCSRFQPFSSSPSQTFVKTTEGSSGIWTRNFSHFNAITRSETTEPTTEIPNNENIFSMSPTDYQPSFHNRIVKSGMLPNNVPFHWSREDQK